jgi:hydrogenase nickel incorporation protein HypA/HybF
VVHEWALGESIVMYVKSLGYRVVDRLTVKVGALQSIDREILSFAIKEIAREAGVEMREVAIVETPPLLRCRSCGLEWRLRLEELSEDVREAVHFVPEAIYAYIRCPRCGGVDFEIASGRGVEEVVIEGSK